MTQPNLPGDPSLVSTDEQLNSLIESDNFNHKYSVEDFFRNPDKSNFSISKDGTHYAFLGPYERRRNIFVQKIGSDETTQITFEKERDIPGFGWANDNRLIYIKDDGGDENFKLFAVDRDGSNPLDLTPFEKIRINIIDSLPNDDAHMIIGMNKENPMLFEPYKINIENGEFAKIATNDNPEEPLEGWMTDNQGRLRIAMRTTDGVNHTLLYRDNEDEKFRDIITTDFTEQISPAHFDAEDSHILYVVSNLGRDKTVLTKFDMHTKKETGEVIFSHDEVDTGGLIWSRKKKKATGITYTTWKSHIEFLDDDRATLQNRWHELIPGSYEINASSADREEEKWILRSYSDRSLGAYYLYERTKDTVTKICDISDWIDEDDMSEMKPITYTTRDGLLINGYLSLPKNKQKDVPLIVHPHGGPWVRDGWGYNPAIQLMTSRGYAVFQMNYRGSTGYGKAFWKKGFKQWGKKMQDDITDGVTHLINEGIANKDKVAIFGGSYGGYATLAGITFTPDVYCCAVDFVGVSNLFTFMKTIPPYWAPYLDTLYEMVGHPERDKEAMEEASPVFHVDKIKVPLLVVQGANDPRVNIDESDQIVRSLKENNIPVEYMVKYNEGHGFANEENKFEFYKVMLGFFGKYLS